MIRKFKIQNDRLTSLKYPTGVTGNVNTYICQFDISCDIPELMWFCVFIQGESVYIQEIADNRCVIPQEVLVDIKPIYIGCYGTNGKDNIKRVSTNQIFFDVKQGAYTEGTQPIVPTPDVWETLINKNIPYIGKNGNWYIYDIETKTYKDSGQPSVGGSGGGGTNLTEEQINNIKDIPSIKEDIQKINDDTSVIVEDVYNRIADLPTKAYVYEEVEKGIKNLKVDDKMSSTSENPVQNKVVMRYIIEKNNDLQGAVNYFAGVANDADAKAENALSQIGDIDSALEAIIAIQTSLMGGDGV